MNMINSLILEGKITKDVEFFVKENGLKVAMSVVSSSRFYITAEGERKEEVTNVEFECYGRMAEELDRYAKKHNGIRVVGRLKQEGNKIFIVGEHLEFRTI